MCEDKMQQNRQEYIRFFKRYKIVRLVMFVSMCVSATIIVLACKNLFIKIFGIWLFFYGCTRFIQFLDVRESAWHKWSVIPRKLKVENVSRIMINNDTYSTIYLNYKKIKLNAGKTYQIEYLSHTHGRYLVSAEEIEVENS